MSHLLERMAEFDSETAHPVRASSSLVLASLLAKCRHTLLRGVRGEKRENVLGDAYECSKKTIGLRSFLRLNVCCKSFSRRLNLSCKSSALA